MISYIRDHQNLYTMKRILLLFTLCSALMSCDTTNQSASTLEKLHGNWYGVEVTNYLINQGTWDTLHPHSITMMTLTLDTADGSMIVDSAGTVLDTASIVVNSDSSVTITSNVSNLGWAFESSLINTGGQPILDSLSVLFTGEQNFKVLQLTQDEAVFYFDTVIPIQYGTFTANMELRHTQYWQK